jgi:pSer/pThr/pTyr-binding forkhead associated (FHA) protein
VCLIRDLDSCNGTLLNGHLIDRARVTRGDVLVLGETELRVR